MSLSIGLHVGAHKTATTHLQRLLGKSGRELAAHGVRYVGPSGLRAPGAGFRDRLGLTAEARRAGRTPAAGLVEMAGVGATRLVISEENLPGQLRLRGGGTIPTVYPTAGRRIGEIVEAVAPVPVDLFLAVRNPVDFVASYYSQALTAGHIQPFADFLEANPIDRIDWLGLVQRLMRRARPRSLTVWRYEDYKRVAPGVLTRLVGEGPRLRLRGQMSAVNTGLSVEAVEHVLAAHAAGHRGDLVAEARALYPLGSGRRRFQPYSGRERAASRTWYAEQMARIAEVPGVHVLVPPPPVTGRG